MKLRIRTKREVWTLTAAVTAIAVMIPLVVVSTAFALAPHPLYRVFQLPILAIAGMIPLLLTPPIAFVMLEIIRRQEEMIRTIDARIMFDMLTGVLNRNHFLDSVRAGQTSGPIMIVDADHFKSINDHHGHAVGDETLRILANAIQQCVGEDGVVGRLGGEEFGVFMSGKSETDGICKAESICDAVRALRPLVSGKSLKLTVSIGCSFHRANKVIGHSLKLADDLLYRAKSEGRDRVVHPPLPARQQLSA